MVTISSPAAFRLAKAKAAVDKAEREQGTNCVELYFEFGQAAIAVADELIEQGFADVETGDDS